MNKTSIEWTHRLGTVGMTWNPIRARLKGLNGQIYSQHVGTFCTRISPGCTHCYASAINKRFGNGLDYTVPNLEKVEFFVDEKILEQPLKRKKPATIFVGDMFDLFHEAIPDELIGRVMLAAGEAKQHTFQFLTKRAKRMHDWFKEQWTVFGNAVKGSDHCWFGVSVESQKYADERIPWLLQTPAMVRFLSVEPQLESIELGHDTPEVGWISYLRGFDGCDPVIPKIDWVICGGESGPHSRPFNLAWAESLREQCKAAGVAFFMKQVGSKPCFSMRESPIGLSPIPDFPITTAYSLDGRIKLHDRKGGDPAEWPESLRVREFPA